MCRGQRLDELSDDVVDGLLEHVPQKAVLTALARVVARHRWAVIGTWIALTVFAAFSATQLADRWSTAAAIPGEPAYEASQRNLKALGIGVRTPVLAVFHTAGDVARSGRVEQPMDRVAQASPGASTSSFSTTDNPVYLSGDRQIAFGRRPSRCWLRCYGLVEAARGSTYQRRTSLRRPRGARRGGRMPARKAKRTTR